MLTNDYIAYFRNIAVKNKKIQHNPLSEDKDGPKAECAFSVFNMDAVTRQLRTQMSDGPCLHLHIYDNLLKDNGASIRGDYAAGFLITQKVKINSNLDENKSYSDCEIVAFEVLAWMKKDSETNGICGEMGIVDMGTIKMTATGPLWDNRFGWWIEFSFNKPLGDQINEQIVDTAFNN